MGSVLSEQFDIGPWYLGVRRLMKGEGRGKERLVTVGRHTRPCCCVPLQLFKIINLYDENFVIEISRKHLAGHSEKKSIQHGGEYDQGQVHDTNIS